jgi:predicted nucleotidyltransferase
MGEPGSIEHALGAAIASLQKANRRFALLGGLAVSVRAEVRFTRDVDLAVQVDSDADAEALVFELKAAGYQPVASVEHEERHRLSTIRLLSPWGVKIDLLFASSGIESEIVDRATTVLLPHAGAVPIGEAEELLAMKVLSMTERRLQDRIDALQLIACNPKLDLARVRKNLQTIRERGYDRGEDLDGKLAALLAPT